MSYIEKGNTILIYCLVSIYVDLIQSILPLKKYLKVSLNLKSEAYGSHYGPALQPHETSEFFANQVTEESSKTTSLIMSDLKNETKKIKGGIRSISLLPSSLTIPSCPSEE